MQRLERRRLSRSSKKKRTIDSVSDGKKKRELDLAKPRKKGMRLQMSSVQKEADVSDGGEAYEKKADQRKLYCLYS